MSSGRLRDFVLLGYGAIIIICLLRFVWNEFMGSPNCFFFLFFYAIEDESKRSWLFIFSVPLFCERAFTILNLLKATLLYCPLLLPRVCSFIRLCVCVSFCIDLHKSRCRKRRYLMGLCAPTFLARRLLFAQMTFGIQPFSLARRSIGDPGEARMAQRSSQQRHREAAASPSSA